MSEGMLFGVVCFLLLTFMGGLAQARPRTRFRRHR